jgi:hypothetical protein
MFREKSHVSFLESRKQLLIAESEINRAQLRQEWDVMAGGVSNLTHRIKSLGPFASAAALLVPALGAFRCKSSVPATAKISRLETLLKGARLVCSIWLVWRARSRK